MEGRYRFSIVSLTLFHLALIERKSSRNNSWDSHSQDDCERAYMDVLAAIPGIICEDLKRDAP